MLTLRRQFLAEVLFLVRHLQLAAGVAARDCERRQEVIVLVPAEHELGLLRRIQRLRWNRQERFPRRTRVLGGDGPNRVGITLVDTGPAKHVSGLVCRSILVRTRRSMKSMSSRYRTTMRIPQNQRSQ